MERIKSYVEKELEGSTQRHDNLRDGGFRNQASYWLGRKTMAEDVLRFVQEVQSGEDNPSDR